MGAISQGSISAGPPGLVLKAWVLFTATAGGAVVVKSAGIASVTRNGVGTFTVVFSSAMATAAYVVQGQVGASQNMLNAWVQTAARTTGQAVVFTYVGGVVADLVDGAYVAFNE